MIVHYTKSDGTTISMFVKPQNVILCLREFLRNPELIELEVKK